MLRLVSDNSGKPELRQAASAFYGELRNLAELQLNLQRNALPPDLYDFAEYPDEEPSLKERIYDGLFYLALGAMAATVLGLLVLWVQS